MPKERVTLLFITNSNGSDKHIYCVGKSKNPRCFKSSYIPVNYVANSKAWMTSFIWTDIMKELDLKFRKDGKKIILFVDNASCHKLVDDIVLANIKIVFLPPNTTSIIQPLDQGIIRSFKSFYRKMIISKQILHLECGLSLKDFSKKVDILGALNMVKTAWTNVTAETIRNCFRKAGFITGQETDSVEETDVISDALGDEIEYLIDVDENVACWEDVTDSDIIEQVIDSTNVEDNDDHIETDESIATLFKPTVKEAVKSIGILTDFFSIMLRPVINYMTLNIYCPNRL